MMLGYISFTCYIPRFVTSIVSLHCQFSNYLIVHSRTSIKELVVPGSVNLCNQLKADNRIIVSVICYILQKQ